MKDFHIVVQVLKSHLVLQQKRTYRNQAIFFLVFGVTFVPTKNIMTKNDKELSLCIVTCPGSLDQLAGSSPAFVSLAKQEEKKRIVVLLGDKL
mgnify:CR=1 FL=1